MLEQHGVFDVGKASEFRVQSSEFTVPIYSATPILERRDAKSLRQIRSWILQSTIRRRTTWHDVGLPREESYVVTPVSRWSSNGMNGKADRRHHDESPIYEVLPYLRPKVQ